MLTKTDVVRLTQKMNDHWSLNPDTKDAVTDKVLDELVQTVKKRLRGMRPHSGMTVEVFIAESK